MCEVSARISILASWLALILRPIASVGAVVPSLPSRATPATEEGASRAPSGYRKTRRCLILKRFLRHLSFPFALSYSLQRPCDICRAHAMIVYADYLRTSPFQRPYRNVFRYQQAYRSYYKAADYDISDALLRVVP